MDNSQHIPGILSGLFPCYIHDMNGVKLPLVRLIFLTVVLCLTLIGCQSSPIVQRTDDELAFASEAVLEMMALIVASASDSFRDADQWTVSTSNLVPREADRMIRLMEEIPGIRRLLDSYLQEASTSTTTLAQKIPQFMESEVRPTLVINEPYAIIEGESDAVTRLFASEVSAQLETWIEEELSGELGRSTLAAWEALTHTYNTHAKGNNLLNQDKDIPIIPLIEVSSVRTITIAMIRHLITNMTTQEALVRTMAPAYEDPRIMLFSAL